MESKEIKLTLYETTSHYIGKIFLNKQILEPNKLPGNFVSTKTIIILDRSGSMGSFVSFLVNKAIPLALQKLNYSPNQIIHLITFDSKTETFETTVEELESLKCGPQGCTYMEPAITSLTNIISQDDKTNANYRILVFSDGELHDQNSTIQKANFTQELIKSKLFNINAHAFRVLNSPNNSPDTRGLSSVLQFNTIKTPELLDIVTSMSPDEISDIIKSAFEDDGLNISANLETINGENLLYKEPWKKPSNSINLFFGENVLWFEKDAIKKYLEDTEKKSLFNLVVNKDKFDVNIEMGEKITSDNYETLLNNKLEYYFRRLKVLKIVNTKESLEEINLITSSFSKIEDNIFSANLSGDPKLSNRIRTLKTTVKKRQSSITFLMNEIKNDQKVAQLNSQMQTDYLRKIDFKNKTARGLAKRAFAEGLDFDSEARKEVLEMSKHLSELEGIDDTNHSISFYSTCSTLEGIKIVCSIINEEFFAEINANDILKLLNIVGVAVSAPVGDFPDPMTYRINKFYQGTFVSISDLITAIEVSGGKNLAPIGKQEEEIINVIPYFEDQRIHRFLLKYAPKLLEYTASIGMRKIIAEVPYTWEYTILAGVWKMIENLLKDKSELNVKIFKNFLDTYVEASGSHFDYVMDLMKEQKQMDPDGLSIYLANNGITNLTKPLLMLISDDTFENKEEMIKRVIRAAYQYECYANIKKLIKKQEDDEVDKLIHELVGIDFEKHKTQLPPLFEGELNPSFYDKFEINKEKMNSLSKQFWWIDYIGLVPLFYKAALSKEPYEEFKKIPVERVTNDILKDALGIGYDFESFKFFSFIQGFIYRTQQSRSDTKLKKMKIHDLVHEKQSLQMIKKLVSGIYAAKYAEEKRAKTKLEFQKVSEELVNKLISSTNEKEFCDLLINGHTIGVVQHKIADNSCLGYSDLRNKLCDFSVDVPLRDKKIYIIILGKDFEDNIVFNKGNALRDLKEFIEIKEKIDSTIWSKIATVMQTMNIHVYRELPNRQGHHNKKQSYWALGYPTLDKMHDAISSDEYKKYCDLHFNCCGLNVQHNVLSYKQEKRLERKQTYISNVKNYKK